MNASRRFDLLFRAVILSAVVLGATSPTRPAAAGEMYGMFDESVVFDPPMWVVYVKKQFTQNGVVEPKIYFMMDHAPPGDKFFIGQANSEVEQRGGPFRTPAEVASVLPDGAVAWNTSMSRFVKNPEGKKSEALPPGSGPPGPTVKDDEGYGPLAITIGLGVGLLFLGAVGWAARAAWLARTAHLARIAAAASTPLAMSVKEFVTRNQQAITKVANAIQNRCANIVGSATDRTIGPQVRAFIKELKNLRGPGKLSPDALRDIVSEAGHQFSDDVWAVFDLYVK